MVGRLYHLPAARAARARAPSCSTRFELDEAGDRLVRTYSGGMRRRLDLAAALVARPPVLFLDEPTTGLDPRSRIALWETIEGCVADGTTVLLTTQYLDEADRLADRIAVIDHGRVIAEGTLRRAEGPGRRRAARDPARREPTPRRRSRRSPSCRGRAPAVDRRHPRDAGPRAHAARSPRRCAGSTTPAIGIDDDRDAPADARRRLPRRSPATPPTPRRSEPSMRSAERAAATRLGHAGARPAQRSADPAAARPADRLHRPADHVRAALRLRLRRRDRDARASTTSTS